MNIQAPYLARNKDISQENFIKGHEFEDYIVTLFNQRHFRLLEWRSDKQASNGAFPFSNMLPDLEFESKGRIRYRFAIECKWRSNKYLGGIPWADRKKISTYLDYQSTNRIQVLVAIGLGGASSNPDKLFITPLDHIKMYTHLYESHLIPFVHPPKKIITYDTQLPLFPH